MSELEYADVKQIPKIVAEARRAFESHATLGYEFRKRQLQNLYRMIDENADAWCEALTKDLRRRKEDSMMLDVFPIKEEIAYHLTHLKENMEGFTPKVGFINMFDGCKVQYEPFGVGLIIGAWNYPLMLTIHPMVGAIAAGNCVVLKPSENAVNVSRLTAKLFPQYLDQRCYKIINGGVEETTVLLKEKFDKILYTGNGVVGKIIMRAATEHLTPVVLELGGKSPVIVDRNLDYDVVAQRVLWGRLMNAGQTCIAPDYILCHSDTRPKLVASLKKTIEKYYGTDPQKSPDFCRIINERQFNRLESLLTPENGTVVLGGQTDRKERYIAPTVIVDPKPGSKLLTDEIFGPILPIVETPSIDNAIKYINARDKPLALYVFSKDKKVIDDVKTKTSSGGFVANDTLTHFTVNKLPFGGVGASGQGNYHGPYSFQTWSHAKATMVKTLGMEFMNDVRYPPFSKEKFGKVKGVLDHPMPKEPSSFVAKALKFTVVVGAGAAAAYFYYINKVNVSS